MLEETVKPLRALFGEGPGGFLVTGGDAELRALGEHIALRILGSVGSLSEVQLNARHIELLAATHRLLHAQRKRSVVPNAGQMSLF